MYDVGIAENLRTFPLCRLTSHRKYTSYGGPGQKAVMVSAFLSDGGVCQTAFLYQREINQKGKTHEILTGQSHETCVNKYGDDT
jgi:hypothetical protein